MTYIGEHLLPGQIGHFAVVLSLIVSLIAAIAFFKSNAATDPSVKKSWLKMARIAFLIETIAVITILSSIFYILSHHLFEYEYAWKHSDKTLQFQYILSCLWEGQEGSFLLWTFWHCALGWVIIKTAGKWEAPVMMVVSLAQFCLATMILGLYIGDFKIGSNPFLLMRNTGIFDGAPMFKDAVTGAFRQDYMNFLKDGSGLNSLLQNYWMVIHPPILFLGFASTIVPFAFAIAGLANKDNTWTKVATSWASFSAGIFGLGIMMGAAWAYESLTFGGYWAWDPVENASLVPWLVLIAGLHTNLIYKHSGYSLKSTYIFYILTFSLVLYSTYLTRSGVLGDTSVHAFTGADMDVQLISFIFIFLVPALILYFSRAKSLPSIAKEENTYSREFWMFIGSLIVFLSGLIIIGKTSVPVVNKVFHTKIASPEDPEYSYNQIQVFIAIVIGLLTGVGQYLKYKNTTKQYFWGKIDVPVVISLALATLISIFIKIQYDKKGIGFQVSLYVAMYMAVFAIVANVGYIFRVLKGKLKIAGPSVAHLGFGMILLGVLISSSNKKLLSKNTTGINLFEKSKDQDPNENITLFKGLKTDMGKYDVTYSDDTLNVKDNKRYFKIDFLEKGGKHDAFSLYPDVIKNNKGNEGFAANPNAKHYWNKDIFIYTSYWLPATEDTASFRPVDLKVGDTTFYSNGFIILNKVDVNQPNEKVKLQPNELLMALDMTVVSKEGSRYPANPAVVVSGNNARFIPDSVSAQGIVLQFNKVADDKAGKLEIGIKESRALSDTITLKALEFPFINVLWLGILIMVIGCFMSVAQNVKNIR